MPAMPEAFQAIYTEAQRAALAGAYVDRRIRPARRVVELAEAGELEPGLPAFEVRGGANTVRDLARKLRARRAGEHASELAKQPPADAIEALRRRLVSLAEEELGALERQPAGKRDLERLRQAARAVREAGAIATPPARGTGPAPRPGHQPAPAGTPGEGTTRGGRAGSLLAAHRGSGAHAHTTHTHREEPAPASEESARQAEAGDQQHEHESEQQHHEPGTWARAQLAAAGVAPEESSAPLVG